MIDGLSRTTLKVLTLKNTLLCGNAKQRGIRCVPSLHELVEDADAIQKC